MQAAIEAMKTAVKAKSEAGGCNERNNTAVSAPNVSTRSSRPAPKQLILNWKAKDKYSEV